jgi:hypothetical protein
MFMPLVLSQLQQGQKKSSWPLTLKANLTDTGRHADVHNAGRANNYSDCGVINSASIIPPNVQRVLADRSARGESLIPAGRRPSSPDAGRSVVGADLSSQSPAVPRDS